MRRSVASGERLLARRDVWRGQAEEKGKEEEGVAGVEGVEGECRRRRTFCDMFSKFRLFGRHCRPSVA